MQPGQRSLPTADCQLPTGFAALPTADCRLATAFCFLLSAFWFLPSACAQTPEPDAPRNAPPPVSRIDPKAQELLDKAVRALGGEAFLNAKNLRTAGRTFAISEGSTAGFAPFESIVQFPNQRRFLYGKDKPITLINDGQRGWQIDKYGLVRQPPEQLRRWKIAARYGFENLLRQIIREPGLLIQDAGRDFTDNLTSRVISITDAEQVQIRLYVHPVRSLPIRVTYRVMNPEEREWEEFSEVYGDYKEFQGIQTPMHITRLLNGERYSEIFRKSAEYNVDAPASSFTPGG